MARKNYDDITIRFRYNYDSNSITMFLDGNYVCTSMTGDTIWTVIKYGCEFGIAALHARFSRIAERVGSRDLDGERLKIELFVEQNRVRTYDHRGKPTKITLSDLEGLLDESDFEFEGAE